MIKDITSLRKAILYTILLLALSLITVLIMQTFSNPATADEAEKLYPVNDNGSTYGSVVLAPNPDQEPDLIAVIATNGSEGYVYKTDLYAFSGSATSLEHAAQLTDRRVRLATDAFISSINDQTGINLEESRPEISNYIKFTSGICGYITPLRPEYDIDLRSLIPIEISDESIDLAMKKAWSANQNVIPVYKSDGVTIIGDFIIQ
ncbi:MAG: hypothetical protein LBU61_04460 [Coriobacteriales bacterium]|nr:hypothetical protein [Coriobacteriales bacterium]